MQYTKLCRLHRRVQQNNTVQHKKHVKVARYDFIKSQMEKEYTPIKNISDTYGIWNMGCYIIYGAQMHNYKILFE